MFFGALSTDIKKSSTIWANLPLWMLKAVNRTNNITEYVINMTVQDNIEQYILPNSPEGDAWTVLYKCEDQEKLKKHVKHVGQFLKHVYSIGRNEFLLRATADDIEQDLNNKYDDTDIDEAGEKEKAREFILSELFFNAIYVRIGVAFSDIAPMEYTYYAKTKDPFFSNRTRTSGYKSYWYSVIKESERAEEFAPWDKGIGVTQAGEMVKRVIGSDDEKEFKFKINGKEEDLLEFTLNLDASVKVYDKEKYNVEAVNGFMIFVHYHLHIQPEDVRENPHLFKPLVHEFETVHSQTVDTFNSVFEEKCFLVKVKRSSDSMIFVESSRAPSTVWNHCLSVCAALPVGSSIGIAFTNSNFMSKKKNPSGLLKRLTSKEPDIYGVNKVDYFGDCVNLSARMCKADWKYPTKLFTTGKNLHPSRVAMCCADQTSRGWSEWKKTTMAFPGGTRQYVRPFLVEDIPRPYLNAGKEGTVLRTISAHVYLDDNIQPGDIVWWEDKIEEKDSVEDTGGTKARRKSLLPTENKRRSGDTEKYWGRVVAVNFLFVTIEQIPEKNWPEPKEQRISRNITYLNKLPQKELTQEATKLKKEDEKAGINKRLLSLKF